MYGPSPDGGICQSFPRYRVGAFPAADLEIGDGALLKDAIEWIRRLPFSPIDILSVEEMGENVSGSGIDTNVIRTPHKSLRTAKMIGIIF